MSAGIQIVGVGPHDAASIEFVERWGVGRCCTRSSVTDLAQLIAELTTCEELAEIGARARDVVRDQFDADDTRERLWRFVAAASDDSRPAPQTA